MRQSLHVNVTYRCNLACFFCVTGGAKPETDFPLDFLQRGLVRARELGAQSVNFCGGEPTVYRDLVPLVATARDLGYKSISLKTNGVKLRDHGYVDALVEAGVNHFSISLHGPAEVHDSLTGCRGSFESATRGIERIHHHKVYLSLPTCVLAPNYRFLPQTAAVLADLGPRLVMPSFAQPKGRADTNFDAMMAAYGEVHGPLSEAVDLLLGRDVRVTLVDFPFCTVRGYERLARETHSQVTHLLHDDGVLFQDFDATEECRLRVKGEQCPACNFAAVCPGPFRTYVQRRGWEEFKPIKDLRLLDVVPVSSLLRHELAAARAAQAV